MDEKAENAGHGQQRARTYPRRSPAVEKSGVLTVCVLLRARGGAVPPTYKSTWIAGRLGESYVS